MFLVTFTELAAIPGTIQNDAFLFTLTVNGAETFSDVPCIVDPNFTDAGLFGLRFFVDNQLSLALDTVDQQLFILSSS